MLFSVDKTKSNSADLTGLNLHLTKASSSSIEGLFIAYVFSKKD
jgi:hypothetical protein